MQNFCQKLTWKVAKSGNTAGHDQVCSHFVLDKFRLGQVLPKSWFEWLAYNLVVYL